MRKRPTWPAGQVIQLEYSSQVLAGNPLDDPVTRTFPAWLPPGYRADRRSGYPVLFDLAGFTGAGPAHVAWKGFDENLPEQLARLTAEGRLGPVIVVFPDCFTALGGNQYINSSAIGNYADYLVDELVPFIDNTLNTLPSREHRGVFGKSSGGYGALLHGMRYHKTWGAIACHSGDAYFDFCYRAEWPAVLTALTRHRKKPRKPGRYDLAAEQARLRPGEDDGRVARFLDHIHHKPRPSSNEVMTLMMLAMAATYDADPSAPNGFLLPFDLESGELLPQRWKRWLAHDPVNLVRRYRKNLGTLRGLFIDCGWMDQFHIHFGSRQVSRALTECGIPHRYEEFADTHSGIDYRMDVSLPFLYRALR